MHRLINLCLLLLILSLGACPTPASGDDNDTYLPFVASPTTAILKWQYGGCYSSWCETGWYSSPAVLDLNNDGKKRSLPRPIRFGL